MSRHQQVDIRLLPCYEKGFAAHFPALAAVLRRFDYRRPLEEEVSLYELVDVLAGMVRDPLVAGPLRQALRSPVQRMTGLRDEARELPAGQAAQRAGSVPLPPGRRVRRPGNPPDILEALIASFVEATPIQS